MREAGDTPWDRGRFDARRGPRSILFGRMYEDPAIEAAALAPGGRVFCIASAGCTARALAQRHDQVVAVDINPVQLEYARRRLAGSPAVEGTAERVMAWLRRLLPLAGWSREQVAAFLDLESTDEQLAVWRSRLCTRRFRLGLDALMSLTGLRAVYAAPFLRVVPRRFGRVLLARLERGFATFANRSNPYARALLTGEPPPDAPAPAAGKVDLVCADAATYLEAQPPASFSGFTLSNILDGASDEYRALLFAAVRRAATPDAVVVLRSFAEPHAPSPDDRAGHDRSMIWGAVRAARADGLT